MNTIQTNPLRDYPRITVRPRDKQFVYDYYNLAGHPIKSIAIESFFLLAKRAGFEHGGHHIPFKFSYSVPVERLAEFKAIFEHAFGFKLGDAAFK